MNQYPRKTKGGFTLLEVTAVCLMIATIVSLAVPSLKGILQKRQLDSFTDRVVQLMEQAQGLAQSQGISWGILYRDHSIWLNPVGHPEKAILWEKISAEMILEASRWPSFSAFGLATSGTILIKNGIFNESVIVSSFGNIRVEP